MGVDRQRLQVERADFFLDLGFGAEHVAVVLSEAAHAQDAVQRAGGLVAVAGAELAVADRQVAVAVQALVEHLDVPRAVHRLQRVGALLRFGEEHVVLVVVPVAGLLPQGHVEDLRAAHFLIAAVAIDLAHVLLDHLPDRPALRVPEDQARAFFLQMEEILLLGDLAMVALLGFFDALDIRGELLLVGPGGAVDALQLLVLGIAAPIGAGNAGQLERLQEARVRHVRAAAHVDVFLVVVQAHGFFVGHVLDQAQLVVLAARLEHRDHLVARRDLLDHVVVLVDQLDHALFDRDQIVGREGALVPDVVVEPFLDHRADHHLRGRVQLLDRVADEMRARMADDLQSFGILGGDDAQAGVMVDAVAGVDEAAVDLTGDGGLGQAGADRGGDVHDGHGMVEFAAAAVGERDCDHGDGCLSRWSVGGASAPIRSWRAVVGLGAEAPPTIATRKKRPEGASRVRGPRAS